MKQYWHTKTLFIKAGKYKWSYKYNHCIKCWTCDHKHKWRWLCTSCWDKQRYNTPKRKEVRAKASQRFCEKNRIPRDQWKKMWPKPKWLYNEEEYKKQWYNDNRPALLLMWKAKRLIQSGKPVMQMMIKWKTRYLPFETLEKPKAMTDPRYNQWKKNNEEFQILMRYWKK